ncbi:MAG: alpha/beta fold hydrolase [Candidatus Gastranaerophilales bacterium]|nr:alpha/beta fold hydrolase [Candidatus Gastranaerophilales bacterium]
MESSPDLDFEFIDDNNIQNTNAVLLFHGLTGSTFEMKKYAQHLHANGFDVFAYCLPGHGEDTCNIRCVSYDDWIEFAQEKFLFLKKKYKKVFLGGLCLGAVLALVLAQKHKLEVAGVISLSTTLFLDGWTMPWYNFMMPLGLNTLIRYYYTFPEREPYGIKNIKKRRSIQKIMGKNTIAMDNYPLSCVYELLKLSKLARKNMKEVISPILIIHSKEDDLTSVKSAKFVYNNINSAKKELFILNDSYHLMLYDNDKDFVFDKSVEFLNTLKQNEEVISNVS